MTKKIFTNIKSSKKTFALSMGALFLSTAVWAASDLSAINAKLAKLLADFNNEKSLVSAVVSKVKVNDTRAVEFAGDILVKKEGVAKGELLVHADYNYPEAANSKPILNLSAEIKAPDENLAKMFANVGLSQEDINNFFDQAKETLDASMSDLTKEYGEAATYSFSIYDVNKDSRGNYKSIQIDLDVAIDLSKLPKGLDPATVELLGVHAHLALDMQAGAVASAEITMNPESASFQRDGDGLKEILDALLNGEEDNEALDEIVQSATVLNQLMNRAVGLE